eukprot:TRINITY_DN73197_c0_g1_i1.p1 TRINITY_DN73197_c0_g1~~TRINITY_DN73197_c0_g1_i1.p1  ORF type:complete len:436 (-),score=114.71 TRINITY_DN73197_c0_g1_i1:154-1407(-)
MAWRPAARRLVVVQLLGATAMLLELPNERAAVELLRADPASAGRCEAEEGARLVSRGWWEAARELVTASHQLPADRRGSGALHTAVRREVGSMKQRADELLLALSPQDSSRIGVVRCSFQWAQNRSAIFLSVKFSHRWTSPGALKVHDESASVSDCCFNFSASGEHSQLRKRYSLDLNFFKAVDPKRWSWQHASAGRISVEIGKAEVGVWEALLAGKERRGNMATWESMQVKWAKDVKEYQARLRDAAKKSGGNGAQNASAPAKKKDDDEDEDAAEAEEEMAHDALSESCPSSNKSPFHRKRSVSRLCEKYWPPSVKGKLGKDRTWLVLFYSPSQMECNEKFGECQRVKDRWLAVAERVPKVSGNAAVGAVDCDSHGDFCRKRNVGHMPHVRRYRKSKSKVYYGEWEIDPLMEFLLS